MNSWYAWRERTRCGDIRACGAHSGTSNTDTKLLIYGLFQKGGVLAQDDQQGKRWWLRLQEKGGKHHAVPVHHKAEAYLDAYLDAGRNRGREDSPLWRSMPGVSDERCLGLVGNGS